MSALFLRLTGLNAVYIQAGARQDDIILSEVTEMLQPKPGQIKYLLANRVRWNPSEKQCLLSHGRRHLKEALVARFSNRNLSFSPCRE